MKKVSLFLIIPFLTLASCKRSDYKTTQSGLKYKIIEAHTGPKAILGDFMNLQIITTVGDSVLMDTHTTGPQFIPLQKGQGRFNIMEGLALLSSGDSAVFLIPADSVMKAPNRPPFVKNGDTIAIHVKVLAIESALQRNQEAAQATAIQMDSDESVIARYVEVQHLKAVKDSLGVYIVTQKKGQGEMPKAGQLVSINYTGKLLNGKVFDSNLDSAFHHAGKPLSFPAGIGEMIRGMDDGIMHLRKGTQATLYIPSGLGYGPQGSPPVIAPNAILVFDVDVLDIKNSVPQKKQKSPGGK